MPIAVCRCPCGTDAKAARRAEYLEMLDTYRAALRGACADALRSPDVGRLADLGRLLEEAWAREHNLRDQLER